MPNFTTESAVRLTFQVADTALVTPGLVNQAIDHAHIELLQRLDPVFDSDPPDSVLILGETLLAGAHLFRSLAARDAFEQTTLAIGSQRIEPGQRFGALTAMSEQAERLAWQALAPFLKPVPAQQLLDATATQPVLGRE